MRKVTGKMLRGYFLAKREWIKANDNYNMVAYGINQAEYKLIDRAMYHITGGLGIGKNPQAVKLKELNEQIGYIERGVIV